MVGQAGMPKETIGTISDIMVEAGKSERTQKILDTFGVDDAAVGSAEFQAIYAAEGPIWIDLVSKLKMVRRCRTHRRTPGTGHFRIALLSEGPARDPGAEGQCFRRG
jgi:hypothetical protein